MDGGHTYMGAGGGGGSGRNGGLEAVRLLLPLLVWRGFPGLFISTHEVASSGTCTDTHTGITHASTCMHTRTALTFRSMSSTVRAAAWTP